MSATASPSFSPMGRDGLPRVAARLAAGWPLRVIYFGGSITDAPGWRVGFDAWLRRTHRASPVTMVNASIGGTGSEERRVGKECRSRWSPYH